MLVATAGHIDHGKTALIGALTGVATDRLPEEQARGITIDLGFAYWRPDDGAAIGFVDVPGHERFVRNMIAGLSGIDCALLVVAADDGIMPQTVEHLHILRLLGIKRGMVAITKADRVDAARIEALRGDVAQLLADTPLAEAPVFAVSARDGSGMAALASALIAERGALSADPDHHFRLAVDRAFSVSGSGTVVTGTVVAGMARIGDALMLSPMGRELRLRAMQSAGRKVEAIGRGERVALNLAGIEVSDIHRGGWVLSPAAHAPTQRIEAEVTLAPTRDKALRHDSGLHLHHGAARIGARLLTPRQRPLLPGSAAAVQLVLDRPISAIIGERFVLRDPSGRELIGGGVVRDPLPPTRRQPLAERSARAAALALDDPAARLAALAAAPGIEPRLAWFTAATNLRAEAAERMIGAGDLLRIGTDNGKGDEIIVARARFERLAEALIAAIRLHHADHPQERGLPRRAARGALGEPVSAALFAALLGAVTAERRIESDGALLRLPGHAPAFSPVEADFWRKALAALEGGPPRAIAMGELARELRLGEAAVGAMLARRKASGDLWQVTASKFMLRQHVAQLAALAARLDADGAAGFTASAFRDASGIGRNFVIQLLEFFDRIGITRRIGESRRMRGDWEAVVGTL